LGGRFVFPLALIRDRPQKAALGPGQVCHLHHDFRPTIDPAAAFDMVQHAVKRLDVLLGNMSDVADMADELAEAEKADAETARNCRQRCRARAYTTLQPILNAAIEQSARVETELADFLKASPVLARYLARWQADD
jgi:hypothetical protein